MILFTCIAGVLLFAIYFAICYALGMIADTMTGVPMDTHKEG